MFFAILLHLTREVEVESDLEDRRLSLAKSYVLGIGQKFQPRIKNNPQVELQFGDYKAAQLVRVSSTVWAAYRTVKMAPWCSPLRNEWEWMNAATSSSLDSE
jgi:hypothetical protein